MMKDQKWKPSSFKSLVVSQSLGALNDNTFKLLIVFNVISILGINQTQTVTSIAGMSFVLPFILFSAIAGWLADRYSKRSILVITKLIEILVVIFGLFVLQFKDITFAYLMIGFMGLQSTFFSPAKYGVIPEIVPKDKVSWANGWISSTTYIGVILGTFLGALLTDLTNKNFLWVGAFCLGISIIGSIFIFKVEKTPAESPNKPFPKLGIFDPFKTLVLTKKHRYLNGIIFTSALFLYIGSFIQINTLAFAVSHLKLSATDGGYIFLLSAMGIGIGSMLSGKLSKDIIELGLLPITILLMGVGLILCFFFATSTWAVICIMVFLGLMGGFLIVPVEAFIQIRSPKTELGSILGCTNFFNFIAILIASATIYSLHHFLKLSPSQIFLSLGCLLICISSIYFKAFYHYVYRLGYLAAAMISKREVVKGLRNISEMPFVLILSSEYKKHLPSLAHALRAKDFYIFNSLSSLKRTLPGLKERSKNLIITDKQAEGFFDDWVSYQVLTIDEYPEILAHNLDERKVREYPVSLYIRGIKKPPRSNS